MDNLLETLYKYGVGDLIDINRTTLLKQDSVYLNDMKDLRIFEQQYEKLDFCQEHRYFINDYIACLQSTNARINDISYMAGIRDAISLFHALGLIETPKL